MAEAPSTVPKRFLPGFIAAWERLMTTGLNGHCGVTPAATIANSILGMVRWP